jgi:TRAP-type C4-dicarboxylate transport system permease small subunit
MLRVLDHLEEWLIALLKGGATLIIFVAVIHRYAAGVPIPVVQDWADHDAGLSCHRYLLARAFDLVT